MSNIHYMTHPDIQFSSLNPGKVEYFSKILSGVTEFDIKSGAVKGRHRLLNDMICSGHSPISEDYFYTRGVAHEKLTSRMLPYNNLAIKPFMQARVYAEVLEEILSVTGWDLTEKGD